MLQRVWKLVATRFVLNINAKRPCCSDGRGGVAKRGSGGGRSWGGGWVLDRCCGREKPGLGASSARLGTRRAALQAGGLLAREKQNKFNTELFVSATPDL